MGTASQIEPSRRPAVPGSGPVRHRLTVADYERMAAAGILRRDDRVELIDGEIIDMSPIGVWHAALVNVFTRYLHRQLGTTILVNCQNPLRLDDKNEPEPDLAILRPRSDSYATAHPGAGDTLAVIEVADTRLAYDLDVKVPLYARHGIPEVWVIEAATRRTHVFRAAAKDGSGRVGYAESLIIDADAPLPFARIRGSTDREHDVPLVHLLPPVA